MERVLERLGARLRQLRETRGVNMTIAREIRRVYGVKIDPSYLSRMERGKAEIPLRTLCALADYYGVQPGALLDEGPANDAPGAGYLLDDPDLVRDIDRLRLALGEKSARKFLRVSLRNMLELLEEAVRRERGERERPPRQRPDSTESDSPVD